jgi:RNA recognition motif-containing protein
MENAEEAINNLNETDFMGRTLRVNEARERRNR